MSKLCTAAQEKGFYYSISPMQCTSKYNIHDLLTVEVIRPKSWLRDKISNPDLYFAHFKTSEQGKPDIRIQCAPFEPDLRDCRVIDDRYFIKEDFIFYRDRYKVARWKVEITGFNNGPVRVKFWSNAFGTLFLNGIIEFFLRHLLLKKNSAMIHSFALEKSGRGLLFPARSAVGKTVTSLYFLDKGYRVLGDNFVILTPDNLYSYPTPMNIFSYNLVGPLRKRLTRRQRTAAFGKFLLYKATLGYAKFLTPVPIEQVFPNRIAREAPWDKVIWTLIGPSFKIGTWEDREGLARAMARINALESVYYLNMIEAYRMVYPGSFLASHWENEEKVFLGLLKKHPLYQMQLPENYSKKVFQSVLDFVEAQ